MKLLTRRCNVNASVTLSGLHDARKAAATFLRMAAEYLPSISGPIREAASLYDQQVAVLHSALEIAALCHGPRGREQRRLEMADPTLRRRLAVMLRQARALDEAAENCLESAMQSLG